MLPLIRHMSLIVVKPVSTLCRCQGEVYITTVKDSYLKIIENKYNKVNILVQITSLRLLHC